MSDALGASAPDTRLLDRASARHDAAIDHVAGHHVVKPGQGIVAAGKLDWYADFRVSAPYGVSSAWIGAAAVLALLYPVCRLFRRYKQAHPTGWASYI